VRPTGLFAYCFLRHTSKGFPQKAGPKKDLF